LGIIARFCGVVTAFAAINWVVLGMVQKDYVRVLMGGRRTPVTDGIAVVVGLAALYLLMQLIKKQKRS
jgi:uncharacterized membrane protein YuzA (DUF378 family)